MSSSDPKHFAAMNRLSHWLHPNGMKAWLELCITLVPEGILILSIDSTERKRP